MDESVVIDCQHIEENSYPFRLYMPIGDRKVVRLCSRCVDILNGIVLTDIVSSAVSKGIMMHVSNANFIESMRSLVRDELHNSLRSIDA